MQEDAASDRFPAFADVLDRIQREPDFPHDGVERIEINCMPSGQATWRAWRPRDDEPVGGVLDPPPLAESTEDLS